MNKNNRWKKPISMMVLWFSLCFELDIKKKAFLVGMMLYTAVFMIHDCFVLA